MPFFIFLFSFLMVSCQDSNSNSFDNFKVQPNLKPPVIVEGANNNFPKAYAILQKNCTSCHFNYHSAWNAYNTEEKWLDAGLVNRGDPENSFLIKRMKNAGGPGATMPIAAEAVSEADFKILKKWIEEIE
jgi:mono/diheme cytochrome c family protein